LLILNDAGSGRGCDLEAVSVGRRQPFVREWGRGGDFPESFIVTGAQPTERKRKNGAPRIFHSWAGWCNRRAVQSRKAVADDVRDSVDILLGYFISPQHKVQTGTKGQA
jgi:hypothetical protein